MVWPYLVSAGRFVASAVGFTAVSNAAKKWGPRLISKARGLWGSLSKNARAVLGIGAGGAGGFGLSELLDAVGIEDSQIQTLSVVGIVIAALVAVGQVLNLDVNL